MKVLSGGQVWKECARLNAYKTPPIEHSVAEASAIYVSEWLEKPSSPMRGVLKFLAKGGVFYTAFTNEKNEISACAGAHAENSV